MTLVLLAYLEWSSKHRCTPANLMAPSVKAVGSSFPCWPWAKCVGLLNMPIIFINGEYESWLEETLIPCLCQCSYLLSGYPATNISGVTWVETGTSYNPLPQTRTTMNHAQSDHISPTSFLEMSRNKPCEKKHNPKICFLLLMEQILHHLGCTKTL